MDVPTAWEEVGSLSRTELELEVLKANNRSTSVSSWYQLAEDSKEHAAEVYEIRTEKVFTVESFVRSIFSTEQLVLHYTSMLCQEDIDLLKVDLKDAASSSERGARRIFAGLGVEGDHFALFTKASKNWFEKSFAMCGLPPPPTNTHKHSAYISTDYAPATLVRKEFNPIKDIELNGGMLLWTNYLVNNSSGSYSHDCLIQQLVYFGLKDVITSVGLADELECFFNDFGLSGSREDIWVVAKELGIPVGVIHAKKDLNLDHPNVHGNMLGCMLTLKSSHGLQNVFGIASTYQYWRIYWLPDSGEVEQVSSLRGSIKAALPEYFDVSTVANKIHRIVHGTSIIPWNATQLPVILGSVILKMKSSPVIKNVV